jgi:hypothetical protein
MGLIDVLDSAAVVVIVIAGVALLVFVAIRWSSWSSTW